MPIIFFVPGHTTFMPVLVGAGIRRVKMIKGDLYTYLFFPSRFH